MRKAIVLFCLLWAGPAWADSFSGVLVDWPVVIANPQPGFGPLLPHGTVLQNVQGFRYVLTPPGWLLIPLEAQWITEPLHFTLETTGAAWSMTGYTPTGTLTGDYFTDAAGVALGMSGNELAFTLAGFQIGAGTLATAQVPEPWPWLLMLAGLAGMVWMRGARDLS